jgi:hypothetical protein
MNFGEQRSTTQIFYAAACHLPIGDGPCQTRKQHFMAILSGTLFSEFTGQPAGFTLEISPKLHRIGHFKVFL